jgi:hypothetical protein
MFTNLNLAFCSKNGIEDRGFDCIANSLLLNKLLQKFVKYRTGNQDKVKQSSSVTGKRNVRVGEAF